MTEFTDSTTYSKLLIHIGYPKTASTWLQNFVFVNSEMRFCVPWSSSRELAIEKFRISNPFKFDTQQIVNEFKDGLIAASERGEVAVISDETLGGDPLNWETNARVIADRIYATFPDARIFICIREQKKVIRSLYSEYIKQGNVVTFNEFIGIENMRAGAAPFCDLEQLEYHYLIDYYQKLFGDRVLVLAYEQLIENRDHFLQNLLNFAESGGSIPVLGSKKSNVSFGAATIELRRLLNYFVTKPDWTYAKQPISFRIISRIVGGVDKIIPKVMQNMFEQKLQNCIETYISGRYAESNKQTSKITGLDLGEYGYD